MTGVELYIRDNDYFYCYKQRHDGYLITDFVKKFGDKIFTMSADEIIHTFHDENFLEYSWGNYHTEGKPLEYGVKIPASEISDDNFDAIYDKVSEFIWNNYNDEDDEDQDYSCGYGDYIVYIDLVNKVIEGIEDEEDEDEDEDVVRNNYLYSYNPYENNRIEKFNDFTKNSNENKFFVLQDENNDNKSYCFLTNVVDDSDDDFLESEIFEDFMEKMETTNAKWSGVHDGSGGEKWFGYSSYEIEDFNTAIKMWFDFFKENNKLGENSEIFITDEDDKIFN